MPRPVSWTHRDRYWIAAHAAFVNIARREAQREAATRRADTLTAA